MKKISDIKDIQQLRTMGLSMRKASTLLGFNRRTVAKYWTCDPDVMSQQKPRPPRVKLLKPVEETVKSLYIEYRNCPKVRRELERRKLTTPSLRTIQKFVQHIKPELELQEKKPVKRVNRDSAC